MGPSDIDLVRECLQGENSAFDILVKKYQKAVYGFCYRMLGDADDAVDASQDSFVKAYHALDTFRQDSRLSPWLFRIAHNTCLDHLRKRARRPVDSLEQVIEKEGEQPASGPGPEKVVLRRETDGMIRNALDRLPDHQRAAMVMFHFNGMSIREISRTLGRPEGTVKSDLHAARESLRRKLKGVVVDV